VVYCSINQIHRTNQVVAVIKALDEVAQAFSCVGRDVINIIEGMAIKKAINELMIQNRALNKCGFGRHIVAKPPT
jgi:hypothetical protein